MVGPAQLRPEASGWRAAGQTLKCSVEPARGLDASPTGETGALGVFGDDKYLILHQVCALPSVANLTPGRGSRVSRGCRASAGLTVRMMEDLLSAQFPRQQCPPLRFSPAFQVACNLFRQILLSHWFPLLIMTQVINY